MLNWYKNFNRHAQSAILSEETDVSTKPRMARYRGTMVYEVQVPSSGNKREEENSASKIAGDLYQRVFEAVGDSVFSYNSPEPYSNI